MSFKTPHISIVSPVYRAEKIIPKLVEEIEKSVSAITDSYEIVLVEDCGPDNSWQVIEETCLSNPKVVGIKLSRNFGQHKAITAGLDAAKGEWVVVMDCDLQDRPDEIPNLYKKALEGFEVVLARRYERQDSFFKRSFSKLFYQTLGYLTDTSQDATIANFGIYHRKVVDSICMMREQIRYFPTMVKWVGFRSTKLNVKHSERFEGSTSYNFKRLMYLALDIILANSDKPLRLMIKAGLSIVAGSVLFIMATLFKFLRGDIIVPGYSSIIISIWFFSGMIIAFMGGMGLYIGRIFDAVKERPIYLVAQKLNT